MGRRSAYTGWLFERLWRGRLGGRFKAVKTAIVLGVPGQRHCDSAYNQRVYIWWNAGFRTNKQKMAQDRLDRIQLQP